MFFSQGNYQSRENTLIIGQYTGKLEGPSQRAIKGKGKKAKNVRVHSQGGDPIFLQDTSPMEQKYSSQSGMESAVKRWQSPHKLNGDPDKPAGAGFYDESKENKKAQEERYKTKKDLKQEKKATKQAERKAYKETDEFKEKRAKTTDTVRAVGRAMMAYAGLNPGEVGESATEKLKKEKEKKASESAPQPKTKTYSEHLQEEEEDNEIESKSSATERRGDLETMSSMMRKIKNPQKRS